MSDIEEVIIDVRDVDHSWFEGITAYLDRDFDRYHFPRVSMERLGELDQDTGDAWLIDGNVEARAEEIDINGLRIPCWSVGCAQLIVRPASTRASKGGSGLSRG